MKAIGKFCLAGLIITFLTSTTTYAQVSLSVGISVHSAPPPLPVYTQPPCPADGYIWTPGYWAYGPNGYYWVPGVWVRPPQVGFLWTPAYWGFEGGVYGFHPGYWGPHIGFYGGINYGYGYSGSGYVGGRWSGGRFQYNSAVNNVNTTIVHNTYINNNVINNTRVTNRSSFNGAGGVNARPNQQELLAMHEHHQQATAMQTSHQQMMSRDRNQLAVVNHGRPVAVQHAGNNGAGHADRSSAQQAHRLVAVQQNVHHDSRPAFQSRPHGNGGFGGHGEMQRRGYSEGRAGGHRRG
ncbi:YXWGXW repeat-containing protein [Chitinophaga polysaccharea]|uniref:YXWGXW repeat-containing protein n=1 Tax=Chitinophaga polysaccharea TaxID=1293035 RepID=UPI0011584140|nr:YXWGXW repeat-containing protein [Chitinophaga polysaccharea]